MSQVSRPVQIALVAILLIGGLWFFALRPKSSSSTSSTPTAVAPAAPAPTAASAASPTKPYNTKTPVVGGLLGAVNKAEGAVATSSANANQLERNSAAASSSSPPSSTTGAGSAAGAPSVSASRVSPTAPPGTQTRTGSASAPAASASTPANPALTIKNQLAEGKTVALMFWNPLASDDQADHAALKSLVKGKNGPLVVDFATPGQIASYGSIATVAQVVETPTLLIMKGKSIESITDLQDPADLRQYIGDVDQGGPGEQLLPKLTAYSVGTTRTSYVARANRLCTRVTHGKPIAIPADSTLQQVETLIGGAETKFVNQLNSIPKPTADASYLQSLFSAERRAESQFRAGFASTNPITAHNLVVSGETNEDFAVSGMTGYGLVDCVVAEDQ